MEAPRVSAPTRSAAAAAGRNCGRDSAPRALAGGRRAPASRRPSARRGAARPRPARPQPSGPRLADRGGVHLPSCRPHPGVGRHRPRAPRPSSLPALPPRSQPRSRPLSPRAPRAPGPGLVRQQARGRRLEGRRRPVPLLSRRSAASRLERLMESRRRGPSPASKRSTPLSPPPQSESGWGWARLLPPPPPLGAAGSWPERLAPSPTVPSGRAAG